MDENRWQSGPILHHRSTGQDHLDAYADEGYDMQQHHLRSGHDISNGVILTMQREGGRPWLSLSQVHELLHAKSGGSHA